MNVEEIVTSMVVLNGGELVGRTRMQKQAYLLDRCGANFGLPFTYYHYGPYCFDLVDGLTDALAEERMTVEERPGRHGVPYAIFRSKVKAPPRLGELAADKAVDFLDKMKEVSDIVLELAATMVFLRDEWDYYGKGEISPIEETRTRKPLKATEERIGKAIDLLNDLGLWERTTATTP